MDKQLSKEECLYETHKHIQGQGLKENLVEDAMDTYAKQEAIAFAEWIKDEYEWCGKWNCWIPKGTAFVIKEERLNSEQLYTIYLLSMKIK